MATRNRINKSSVRRSRGPTHTHDYPVKGRKRKDEEEGTINPEYGVERSLDWDEEGAALQSDCDYGAGSRFDDEDITDQEHMPPHRIRDRRGDPSKQAQEETPEFDDLDFEPPEERNNYDDADKIYPPSWRH